VVPIAEKWADSKMTRLHALSSGETQASFPALFEQENGSCLSLTAQNCAFSCRSGV